jgi:hypothetical protein
MLLLVGFAALYRAHSWLRARWSLDRRGGVALAAVLLIVPLLAMVPGVYLRGSSIFEADPESGLPRRIQLLTLLRPPTVAGIRASAPMVWHLTDAVDDLQRTTMPGEPILPVTTAAVRHC